MKTLIVYDSAFGNTQQIAFAMRDAISDKSEIAALKVDSLQPIDLKDIDLLIVGSPTQKFNPLPGITDWLKSIQPKSLEKTKVAAFDTRIDLKKANNRALNFFVFLFGYAAKPIAKKLIAKGGTQIAPPEGFFVEGTNGPVTEGELQRASEWAGIICNKNFS